MSEPLVADQAPRNGEPVAAHNAEGEPASPAVPAASAAPTPTSPKPRGRAYWSQEVVYFDGRPLTRSKAAKRMEQGGASPAAIRAFLDSAKPARSTVAEGRFDLGGRERSALSSAERFYNGLAR